MQKFIILNQEDIAQLLTMQDVLAAVEKAYSCKCSKQAELFPLVCHSFEDGYEEFDIKSGSADDAGIFGMKLVSAFARNSDLGLPRLTGTILIFDRKTGMLRSMMDGGLITNMRTGAAGGVGCKVLARPESETVLLVGTGAQGPMLLRAVLSVMRKVKRILVVNPHTPQKAKSFVEDFHQILAAEFPHLHHIGSHRQSGAGMQTGRYYPDGYSGAYRHHQSRLDSPRHTPFLYRFGYGG